MKKLLFALPVILLVAAGCNSSSPTQSADKSGSQNQGAPASTGNSNAIPADWKTYTSTEYNFSFQYPKDWEVNDTSSSYKGVGSPSVIVSSPLISGVPGASRDSYFYVQLTPKNGSIEHKEGINLSLLRSDGGPIPVNISQEYLQSTPQYEASVLIRQSFQISSTNSSTKGWKTYTNSAAGFSFSYPSDLTVKTGVDKQNFKLTPEDPNEKPFYWLHLEVNKNDSFIMGISMNPPAIGVEGKDTITNTTITTNNGISVKKKTFAEIGTKTVDFVQYDFSVNDNGFFVTTDGEHITEAESIISTFSALKQ